MTPYEMAQDVLQTVADLLVEPPTVRFAQLGPAVIDCASVISAATALEENPTPGCACGSITVVTTVARDCAFTSNEDGSNNPEVIAEVSAKIDGDGIVLRQVGALYIESEWSVGWSLDGGLAITSLALTMPLPCG